MPFCQFADAGAQSTCNSPITNSQTSITLQSASGFPALLANGQLSVIIYDSGNPAYVAGASPFTVNYEYQPLNSIVGNVITTGPGDGAASRAAYAGTTPKSYSAGATIAVVMLAEDIVASVPWKFDDQTLSAAAQCLIPASGSIPASYLGIAWRHLQVRYRFRTTGAPNGFCSLYCQFNGDQAGDYLWAQLYNLPPTSPAYNESFAQTWMGLGLLPQGGSTADMFGEGQIEINDYAGSQIKKARGWSDGSYGLGTPGIQFALRHGIWNNGAAITSLRLFPSDGTTLTGDVQTYLIP